MDFIYVNPINKINPMTNFDSLYQSIMCENSEEISLTNYSYEELIDLAMDRWGDAYTTREDIVSHYPDSESLIAALQEENEEREYGSEPPEDHFRDDVEADADTLASAGYGTDEDYGGYSGGEDY